ncbi:hypothetical protein M758_4G036800 [Ceratodon purpureus]|nr:hypothetical protein M758_4G036800 [Ceratodon purpureus]
MHEESGRMTFCEHGSRLDVDSRDQYGKTDVQAEFIGKSEDKYQNLSKELEPSIEAKYKKRCEEAVKEGGSKSVHVLGSWTIPSLITDEEAFRKQIM